jgi:hypothetical protein
MSAMFCDNKGTRLRQIIHLTSRVSVRHGGYQGVAASRTDRWKMIDDHVGLGGLPKGLTPVALLPARLFAGRLAQARHPRWPSQPVARRRLAAVGAVQAETTLKLRHARHKLGDMRSLRLNQRNQFFSRRNIRRYSDHPILESETDSHVQENPIKITATGNNLGSYYFFQ